MVWGEVGEVGRGLITGVLTVSVHGLGFQQVLMGSGVSF